MSRNPGFGAGAGTAAAAATGTRIRSDPGIRSHSARGCLRAPLVFTGAQSALGREALQLEAVALVS